MKIFTLPKKIKLIGRYKDIINAAFKYGFGFFFEKIELPHSLIPTKIWEKYKKQKEEIEPNPVRFRKFLEELGPTFIKLGQLLSTRPDIFPLPYIEELVKLQDQTPPQDFQELKKILEEELGNKIKEFEIEETPIASGSIAQIHSAVLNKKWEIVIKIRKIGIQKVLETDIEILSYIAYLLENNIPETKLYHPIQLVEEFKEFIENELDFRHEAYATEKMKRIFQDNHNLKVPNVYWEYSSEKILVLEKIKGEKITNLDFLKKHNISPKIIAQNLADSYLKQITIEGFYHSDPHPGNILVDEKGIIKLLDFGQVGRLDNKTLEGLSLLFLAILEKDVEKIVRRFSLLSITPRDSENLNLHKLYGDLEYFLETVFNSPLKDITLGKLLKDMLQIAIRHNLSTPPYLSLLTKTLIQLESTISVLYPELNTLNTAKPYAKKVFNKLHSPRKYWRSFWFWEEDIFNLIKKAPEKLTNILDKIEKGKLGIEFYHKSLEDLSSKIDKASNRIAVSLIIGAILLSSSFIMLSGKGTLLFGFSLLGIICFITAGILGIWLVISIFFSGRL